MQPIHYIFSIENPQQQYIQIQVNFIARETTQLIQLPSWRPGRYEIGNFAKNVRDFQVIQQGKQIHFEKISKDCWKIEAEIGKEYSVHYQYYAAELNAGSSLLNTEQLYVNPVNCCIYIKGQEEFPCEIQLEIPEDYRIACSLKQTGKYKLVASNFDELADSPWIASPSLKHDTYIVENAVFHLWFQGECKPDFGRLKNDFTKFTTQQLNQFGEFPFNEYHFLFQIVPFHAYHGVEHLKSTVLYLGSSVDLFDSFYAELLGVCSHELYHSWNVKSIRPIEMFPYDFTKENYSKLGYLCEGVTTYMGDLMLLRSGVFSVQEYFLEMNKLLQKHFDNFARKHTSVAASSFDTWLDGYVSGVPGRKVSIYTEGALLSFLLDVFILYHSKGKFRLDDVMKDFYEQFAKKKQGVSEQDFWRTVQSYLGEEEQELWTDFYHGTSDFEPVLQRAFGYVGLQLNRTSEKTDWVSKLGGKTEQTSWGEKLISILPNSEFDQIGLMVDDEIVAVNEYTIRDNFNKWLNYFQDNEIRLTIVRNGKLQTFSLTMEAENKNRFDTMTVSIATAISAEQKLLFERWRS